jgi:replication factor C small subunit
MGMYMTDNLTLLEKYQPDTLENVYGHQTIRQILMSMVDQQNIPHMLFVGTPGNGKSTTAMALMKDLYGDEYKSNHIKISTSSEELGIDTVRGKIKDATKYKSLNYPFKTIIIEEADGLSPQAQFAFREIMLKNQQITRFILICNNLDKIIPPIQDRCQLFRFAQLQLDDILNHLKLIVEKEDIHIIKASRMDR